LEQARKAFQAHDLKEAKALLKQVFRADPRPADAYLLLGLAEAESGKTREAIKGYQRAIEPTPDSLSAHYNLAVAYLREQEVRFGLQEPQHAVALSPHNSDAAHNLGVALLETGKPRSERLRLGSPMAGTCGRALPRQVPTTWCHSLPHPARDLNARPPLDELRRQLARAQMQSHDP
jgi:Tfp pilus assembly protein PilF